MIGTIISMVISLFVSFALGVVMILFTGGGTTLQYLKCKFKRTKKIFIWVDTFTGRESVVGIIEGNIYTGVVSWEFNKTKYLTEINQINVKRWKDIYYMALNIEAPMVAYDLTKTGEIPLSQIDLKKFQNILDRALTKPSLDEDMVFKLLIVLCFGIVIVIGILAFIYFKIDGLGKLIEGLNIL
jgi:hypothetical protein